METKLFWSLPPPTRSPKRGKHPSPARLTGSRPLKHLQASLLYFSPLQCAEESQRMTGPDLLMLPSSLVLLGARPLSPPCQPRQSPRLRLPTTAGACQCLAPVPRLPKFILLNRTGLSCTRRVGEGATLPWDSRASPQAASSPQAPRPPSATDPVTTFVAPTSRSTDQSAAP